MPVNSPDNLNLEFPVGSKVTSSDLECDPYAVYKRLRDSEPVSYVQMNNMYYVTRHDLCIQILMDAENFTVGFEKSTVHDIFGDHMMSVDGEKARRYKKPHRKQFMRQIIQSELVGLIRENTARLIDSFAGRGHVELKQEFASRLPVLTMLDLFGLPKTGEIVFRVWYDAFENALANNSWDETIRQQGKCAVAKFHNYLQNAIKTVRKNGSTDYLLGKLVNSSEEETLTDAEIRHNALIIFFGGISTVEALILNALYALSTHPNTFARVRQNIALLPKVIEETVRWRGPVQSAHRHVRKSTRIGGVDLPEGAVVSCVIASANHDEAIFDSPEIFDIDRQNSKHIAFATGPHICLGLHLARTEANIALEEIITCLDGFRMNPEKSILPTGSEFHQPIAFHAIWNA